MGVLQAFVDRMDELPDSDLHYDYVGGVSIGAVMAASIAIYPPGQEREAVNNLKETYMTTPITDLIEFRKRRIVAMARHESIAMNQKFRDFI